MWFRLRRTTAQFRARERGEPVAIAVTRPGLQSGRCAVLPVCGEPPPPARHGCAEIEQSVSWLPRSGVPLRHSGPMSLHASTSTNSGSGQAGTPHSSAARTLGADAQRRSSSVARGPCTAGRSLQSPCHAGSGPAAVTRLGLPTQLPFSSSAVRTKFTPYLAAFNGEVGFNRHISRADAQSDIDAVIEFSDVVSNPAS